jgi:membrane-associated phospholipid phosphatase
MTSADGILGDWDGTTQKHVQPDTGAWSSLERVEVWVRLAILETHMSDVLTLAEVPGGLPDLVMRGGPAVARIAPPDDFRPQLPHLRAYADLRSDRMAEIDGQITDLIPYFAQIGQLLVPGRKWSLLFMMAAQDLVATLCMNLKHRINAPRPTDYAPQVLPVIRTPSHSTLPSGHATESFALATILEGLMQGAPQPVTQMRPGDVMASLPLRLAARIAENRVVAGVHFPVDSAAGAAMGIAAAEAVMCACVGGAAPAPALWEFDGDAFGAEDFLLATLAERAPGFTVTPGTDPAPEASELLGMLWAAALAEWHA